MEADRNFALSVFACSRVVVVSFVNLTLTHTTNLLFTAGSHTALRKIHEEWCAIYVHLHEHKDGCKYPDTTYCGLYDTLSARGTQLQVFIHDEACVECTTALKFKTHLVSFFNREFCTARSEPYRKHRLLRITLPKTSLKPRDVFC